MFWMVFAYICGLKMKPTLRYRFAAMVMMAVVCVWLSFQSMHQWLDHHFEDHHHALVHHDHEQNEEEDCPFCKIQVIPFVSEPVFSFTIDRIQPEILWSSFIRNNELTQIISVRRLRGPPQC
jgi:hypothetical protein